MARNDLQICTFNCRSVKNCLPVLRELCDRFDFILLQEHWLLPDELGLLNNIHEDFLSFGVSAVDVSRDVLVGRPFGGTAILYRKMYANRLHLIQSNESRITSMQIDTNIGPLLLATVYMPTNYGDNDSMEQYIECLSKLEAIIIDTDAAHVLIAGDFNCDSQSRFYPELCKFLSENEIIMSDRSRLSNVSTFVSDDGCKSSWIDHVLATACLDKIITTMTVLDDVIVSDHKPLSFSVNCHIVVTNVNSSKKVSNYEQVPLWSSCNDDVHCNYETFLDSLLQHVDIPVDIFNTISTDDTYKNSLDKFCVDIIDCIKLSVSTVIPKRTCHYDNQFNVPGWNTYVREKHDFAREAYLSWVHSGKPKFGIIADSMRRSRAVFKLAVRYCKNNIEQMKADACADCLTDKDANKFWRNVQKISNNKATNLATSVGGCSGVDDVTEMWKQHFEDLYSKSVDSKFRPLFEAEMASKLLEVGATTFSIVDVMNAVDKQKLGKCPGPDGIHMEAFRYGGKRLCIMLCLLFNACMKFGYIPSQLINAVIVPLVKCKTGDLSDADNYRAITMSNSISKILELLLLEIVENSDDIDAYQFGFQKGVSTALCTHVFKSTVDYYRRNGSHVFCCFIDFKKAFDRVDYWLLFTKLIDSNKTKLCYAAARLLAYWYSHQQVFIRWQGNCSQSFFIGRGVRQGGLMSPYLFKLYIRDLLKMVVDSEIGCNIAGCFVNTLAYADDLILMAPSWRGLQCLLNIVEDAAKAIDMVFNTNKTVCMIFSPTVKQKLVSESFPQFRLVGKYLSFVPTFKYLGHIIDNKLMDDTDVQRELKCLFTRVNILTRRFSRCSLQVKLRLFRSYCICFYDIALWKNVKVCVLNKLKSAYVKCLKLFFNFPKYHSVTDMLLKLGLPSFNTVLHNASWSFLRCLSVCSNRLVRLVCDFVGI